MPKRKKKTQEEFIVEHTASMLSRDFNLPPELARSFAEMGHWQDNGDGTVSFAS